MKLYLGILIFFVGQIIGWYHLNLQKFSTWWEDKPLMAAIIMGIPTSLCFWHAWRLVSESMDSVWSARFIGSCTGFIVFPILTWFILGESMFTTKTMICLFLSFAILFVQIFY
ncbi:MAG TPA: hypothetical protein DCM40_18135 [Maribacter sp.]|nr:hypothetical protein [Maribacter sp.]|tara:strand:+ start:112 stop:450 length:339 start_codon:yes stop_codon:yes gene_type:complete